MKKLFVTFLVTIMLISLSLPIFAETILTDVPKTHWAAEAVNMLTEIGILTGYTDQTFRGQQNITRYELAVALQRLLLYLDPSTTSQLSDDELLSLNDRLARLEEMAGLAPQTTTVVVTGPSSTGSSTGTSSASTSTGTSSATTTTGGKATSTTSGSGTTSTSSGTTSSTSSGSTAATSSGTSSATTTTGGTATSTTSGSGTTTSTSTGSTSGNVTNIFTQASDAKKMNTLWNKGNLGVSLGYVGVPQTREYGFLAGIKVGVSADYEFVNWFTLAGEVKANLFFDGSLVTYLLIDLDAKFNILNKDNYRVGLQLNFQDSSLVAYDVFANLLTIGVGAYADVYVAPKINLYANLKFPIAITNFEDIDVVFQEFGFMYDVTVGALYSIRPDMSAGLEVNVMSPASLVTKYPLFSVGGKFVYKF